MDDASLNLSAEFVVRPSASANLYGGFVVKQWAEDLPATFFVLQGIENLATRFRTMKIYDLRGTTGIGFNWQGANNPPESIVDFIVGSPTGFWVGEFYDGPAELRPVFIPWHKLNETGLSGTRPNKALIDEFTWIVHTNGLRRIDNIYAFPFGNLLSFFNVRHPSVPWLNDFGYRRSHVIEGATGAGTGYQVQVTVHREGGVTSGDEVYLNGKCLADFGDIRFTADDMVTELDYLLFGASAATPGFYPAENARNLAAYVNISPAAYYYDGKTYFAYQGLDQNLHPYVNYYDHGDGSFATPVRAGTNPLSADAHGYPAVIRDDSGYIHVFYGSHNTAQKHAKSDNPDDISAWTAQADAVADKATYPNVLRTGANTFYLFYRKRMNGDHDLMYKKTIDNFGSWGAETTIIDIGAQVVYPSSFEFDPVNNRIHLTWFNYDPTDYENVYHAYLDLSDGKMYSMDGTDLGAIISLAEADANCKILTYSSTTLQPFSTVHLNSSQDPYIIYFDGNYNFTRWTGAAWTAAVVIDAGPQASIDFNIVDANNIEAYLVKNDDNLYEFVSTDGGATWDAGTFILAYASPSTGMWMPKIVKDYQPVFKIICGEVIGDFTTDINLHAWGDSGELTNPDAVFFVEIQGDLDSDRTIYIYYDKAGVTTTSNGENTFPALFDDLDDYSINDPPDAGIWTTEGTGGGRTIDVQQDPADATKKVFRLHNIAGAIVLTLKRAFPSMTGLAAHFRLRVDVNVQLFFGGWEGAANIFYNRRSVTTFQYYNAGSTYSAYVPNLPFAINTWYSLIQEATKVSGDYMHLHSGAVDGAGALHASPTVGIDNLTFVATSLLYNVYIGGEGQNKRYIFVRKFVTPEPVHGSWGVEETKP